MDILSTALKLLFRIKYWLIFLPLFATLIAIYQTRNMQREFVVNTTIYTGIASGFTIESGLEAGRFDWASVNNGLDNLISIITSKSTLRNVSLRLYIQHMIYGDSISDNNFILAKNYRNLLRITPREVQVLIDKTSEEKTLDNLNAYEKESATNFVYGLFNWYHPHYSYGALSRVLVKRISNSDMIQIQYSSDDPGIAYNTLVLLNDEFVRQYELLRFGETNNVIKYFRSELDILGSKLRASEDSLTKYYIDKKIINYTEQTKQVSALSFNYELIYNDLLLKFTNSSVAVKELESKVRDQVKIIENNSLFLNKLNNISMLSSQVTKMEAFKLDSVSTNVSALNLYKSKLKEAEDDLKTFSSVINNQKYTKEGIATSSFVEEWVNELINKEKYSAGMKVMEGINTNLGSQYTYFAPIGSTLNRKEREIKFTEQSYLSLLQSLNAALMRQKTLEMTAATLKAIDPPFFPITPIATARKAIVVSVFVGTIIFIISFFIFLEIFDRTVRDSERAQRLIPAIVLGAFPKSIKLRFRAYNKEYKRIAINYLANSIVPYLNPKERPDIINFISSDDNVGKSELIKNLKEYWEDRGIRIKVLSWHDEISPDTRDFIVSTNLTDLYDYDNEDIIMVEHKSIIKSAIPLGLLKEASINIMVIRADKVWRDIDKIAFTRLKEQIKNAPVLLYLTETRKDVAENFMGMLPPYSKVRKFVYKLIQFGLTSK